MELALKPNVRRSKYYCSHGVEVTDVDQVNVSRCWKCVDYFLARNKEYLLACLGVEIYIFRQKKQF
jgi:hypothetical protein